MARTMVEDVHDVKGLTSKAWRQPVGPSLNFCEFCGATFGLGALAVREQWLALA